MSSLPILEIASAVSCCSSSGSKIKTKRQVSLARHALPPINHKALASHCGLSSLFLSSRRQGLYPFHNIRSTVSCTMSMAEGDSSGPRRLNLELDWIKGEINKVWEGLPQPVKRFPWPEALENFFELVLGLVFAVAKYLSIPVLALTSLSEFSYCAHERKMRLIPIPLLVGIGMAGIFKDTARELYPQLKEGDIPWHLVGVAAFFILLKLPGPYHPYWGRIFIPHFANGGLLRLVWSSVMWYRNPPPASKTTLQQSSTNDEPSSHQEY